MVALPKNILQATSEKMAATVGALAGTLGPHVPTVGLCTYGEQGQFFGAPGPAVHGNLMSAGGARGQRSQLLLVGAAAQHLERWLSNFGITRHFVLCIKPDLNGSRSSRCSYSISVCSGH